MVGVLRYLMTSGCLPVGTSRSCRLVLALGTMTQRSAWRRLRAQLGAAVGPRTAQRQAMWVVRGGESSGEISPPIRGLATSASKRRSRAAWPRDMADGGSDNSGPTQMTAHGMLDPHGSLWPLSWQSMTGISDIIATVWAFATSPATTVDMLIPRATKTPKTSKKTWRTDWCLMAAQSCRRGPCKSRHAFVMRQLEAPNTPAAFGAVFAARQTEAHHGGNQRSQGGVSPGFGQCVAFFGSLAQFWISRSNQCGRRRVINRFAKAALDRNLSLGSQKGVRRNTKGCCNDTDVVEPDIANTPFDS